MEKALNVLALMQVSSPPANQIDVAHSSSCGWRLERKSKMSIDSLRTSYNGISNSLSSLESDAEELGDDKLIKLIRECEDVDVKIGQYIDETYGPERGL